jgi:hypothetical protein
MLTVPNSMLMEDSGSRIQKLLLALDNLAIPVSENMKAM